MNRFLVGVDGSPESKAAAQLATDLARAHRAKVLLVYCVAPITVPDPLMLDAYGKAQREFGEQVLREMSARCADRDVAVERLLVDGSPAVRLAELASERDVDLVVVGHRGRGAVPRFLLGSVADRLVQTSPKPVLVVR
jgi:nucleotide-binding universal stress UspA family protein